jgi:hypothetical protein
MYDCVTVCIENNQGSIMTDEMGLGRTLQCITIALPCFGHYSNKVQTASPFF